VSKSSRQASRIQARQRAAEEQRRREQRRRLGIAGAAIGVVLVVLASLVVVKLATGGRHTSGPASQPADSTVIAAVTGVSAATLDAVGKGKVDALPKAVTGQQVLTDGGKPLVLYMGAEYCPYCAAERWAMVVALSRFGTFSNLGQTHSASADVYPNTATLSFHGASYASQYLTFQGVETQSNEVQGNGYAPLDTPTAQQQQLAKTFNAPPYVDSGSAGSIPFIDFANQAVVSGASYSPQLLAGKEGADIAAALANPHSDIAIAVDGTANAFTALLCQLTGGQPATVCTTRAATAYQESFHAAA
jgi:thiol-disulfide isomerase/thioredoxin